MAKFFLVKVYTENVNFSLQLKLNYPCQIIDQIKLAKHVILLNIILKRQKYDANYFVVKMTLKKM